jgi:type II secretion system protein C
MKHPFWIINSTLFLFVLLALGFIFLYRVDIPEHETIKPHIYSRVKKQEIQINISKIYENDLFDTYVKEAPPHKEPEELPFPEPPLPQPVTIPEIPKPQFLDPLNITLKGIVVVRNDNTKNRAIIMDNKTNKELVYKTGDVFEDAQLIRISGIKVIFLRANGQQEVLYLREQDAKMDPMYAVLDNWEAAIQPLGINYFMISPREFTRRVTSLGQFIEMLSLTTAYKQGKSIGCRVGEVAEKSLGAHLGLQTSDIIISINHIPATTTENRLKIYKEIVDMQYDDTITVRLRRNKTDEMELLYKLEEFTPQPTSATPVPAGEEERKPLDKIKEEEKIKALEQQYKFAPTLQEIRTRERQLMFNKGKAP